MSFDPTQKGDVKFYLEPDGGEMVIENGIAEMSSDLENMFLLCLLGGNYDDAATPDTAHLQWLGNEDVAGQQQYRSRFLHTLRAIPLNSTAIKTIREAASTDIALGFGDLLESVSVSVQILTNIRVGITCITTLTTGASYTFRMELDK